MPIEVEMKFPLQDDAALIRKLDAISAVAEPAIEQTDRYFNHPSRDFGQTDEALRIRATDGRHRVTYKGRLLDSATKTRREIEVPIGETGDDGERFGEILKLLGFQPVRKVKKLRRPYSLTWDCRQFEIVLDEVEGLGLFAELETEADESDRDAATQSLLRLAEELRLTDSTRQSYLQMLLAQDG